ncbi:endonuclease dU [Coleofasciculus sp.]|uniref:endonuclease dU n=1 Tax=Coleofasciculus sp. TaxID=3100458 RepID=UPI003A372725
MELDDLVRLNRVIRVIGFDDAPFSRHASTKVSIAGVVCAGTRFEGMVWGEVERDGWDATDRIVQLLVGRKFLPQLHVLLLDGIGFGGFNLIDLPQLCDRLNLPCVSLMRRMPNLEAVKQAIHRLPQPEQRLHLLQRAGTIHAYPPFFFQVCGANPQVIASVLERVTDCGKVPEALRLAHLIGAAVVKGESSSSA